MIFSAQSPCLSTSRQNRRRDTTPMMPKGEQQGGVSPRPPSPLRPRSNGDLGTTALGPPSHVSRTFTSSTRSSCLSGKETRVFLFHFTLLLGVNQKETWGVLALFYFYNEGSVWMYEITGSMGS